MLPPRILEHPFLTWKQKQSNDPCTLHWTRCTHKSMKSSTKRPLKAGMQMLPNCPAHPFCQAEARYELPFLQITLHILYSGAIKCSRTWKAGVQSPPNGISHALHTLEEKACQCRIRNPLRCPCFSCRKSREFCCFFGVSAC